MSVHDELCKRQDWLEAQVTEARIDWIANWQESWEAGDDVPGEDYFIALWIAERAEFTTSTEVAEVIEMKRQLALYRKAINRIDDRIEYVSFTKHDIYKVFAGLTAALANKTTGEVT